jgi:hypothetical protein
MNKECGAASGLRIVIEKLKYLEKTQPSAILSITDSLYIVQH